MNSKEINKVLQTFTIIVDTREQENERFERRIKSFPCPICRRKLSFGDYSAMVTMPDGSEYSILNEFVIERKEDLKEICSNFTANRERFIREFERAQAVGAKIAILVENATWDKAYGGMYRSKMSPAALTASLTTWLARYNCTVNFCKEETAPKLIYDLLYREMKERLASVEVDQIEHG